MKGGTPMEKVVFEKAENFGEKFFGIAFLDSDGV